MPPRATRVNLESHGPRGLRQPHRYNVTIIRTDGTPVNYPDVKHVMYQNESVLLMLGEHDIDRQYVRYPARIVDHVVAEEIPNEDEIVDPRTTRDR